MEIDFDVNEGGCVPSVVFKQNSYFTYFMKLFWSRTTCKATNHFRKDQFLNMDLGLCVAAQY